MSDNLLEVSDLSVHYPGRANWFFQKAEPKKAVDGISFVVPKGKTVGLVGESGSGKTTTGRAIVKLAPLTAGKILYHGQDIGALSNSDFLPWRKKIQPSRSQRPFRPLPWPGQLVLPESRTQEGRGRHLLRRTKG